MSTTKLSTGRPGYHFIHPQGWINDPCAPGYDPATGTYHLFYQWNPHSHLWGNISWGHAQSKDLLHWTHDSKDVPALVPGETYDRGGVFTGCFVPTGPRGEQGGLTLFYTSITVTDGSLHYTAPHVHGSEGLSMATSADSGKTWIKAEGNPILVGEPEGLQVTGFRDPFVSYWPHMDQERGTDRTLYGILSGGLRGDTSGPRLFLFSIADNDLTQWTFIRTLLDVAAGQEVAGGDLGRNFECGSVVSLSSSSGSSRDFILTGAEGAKDRHNSGEAARLQVWLKVSNEAGLVLDGSSGGGLLDYGVLYASAPFSHPDGRTLLWGWMPEEDVPEAELARKAWTGCIGLPRELFLARYDNVTSGSLATLRELGFEVENGEADVTTVNTLGIRPLAELQTLRKSPAACTIRGAGSAVPWRLLRAASLSCEVEATFILQDSCTEVGIIVRHDEKCKIETRVVYHPLENEIRIIRSKSTTSPGVNTSDVVGKFALFRTRSDTGAEALEPLHLRVFVDHDTLEVFANDRFALSTWIYSPPECTGISLTWGGDESLRDLDDSNASSRGVADQTPRYWDRNARLQRVDVWEIEATSEVG